MAHFKRKKPRTAVACTMCSQHKYKGNSTSKRGGRHKPQEHEARRLANLECQALLTVGCSQ